MAMATTVIWNKTQEDLEVQVGNHRQFVDLATIKKGAQYTLKFDSNSTYQEYFMGIDATGNKLVISTDDCCDYKTITINDVDGKFNVLREPRHALRSSESETTTDAVKKHKFSWRFWTQTPVH